MRTLSFFNVGKLCSQIALADPQPIVDLAGVTFVEPFGLVYLGMFLRYFNARGRSFRVILPSAAGVRDYLARQRFWERFNFNPEVVQRENLRRFTTSTSLNDIADIEKEPYVAEELAAAVAHVVKINTDHLPPTVLAE